LAPSALPDFSATMNPSDFPRAQLLWLCLPRPPYSSTRDLSVPGFVIRHAPLPSTPESPATASTRCFHRWCWLHPVRRTGRSHCLTRLIRIRLSLRLTPSPHGASYAELLRSHARSATWLASHSHGRLLSSCKTNTGFTDAPHEAYPRSKRCGTTGEIRRPASSAYCAGTLRARLFMDVSPDRAR
jgi:hypothetical protein